MLTKTAQRYFIFTCRCIATRCQFLLLRGHLLVQDVYSSAEQSLATGKGLTIAFLQLKKYLCRPRNEDQILTYYGLLIFFF